MKKQLIIGITLLLLISTLTAGCITANSTDTQATATPTDTAVQENTYAPTQEAPTQDTSSLLQKDASKSGTTYVERSFTSRYGDIAIHFSIPNAVISGAKNTTAKEKIADGYNKYWYYFVTDPLMTPLYDEVLERLSVFKSRYSMDSDEYVEFISAFVQHIPYDDDAKRTARYPVETLMDNTGDCDEKSVLLAGLLDRAGYDTALLLFDAERHMTAGIRAGDEFAYPHAQGYAVIESTRPEYITNYHYNLSKGTKLTSTPEVILIGNGKKTYTAGAQVKAIITYREQCEKMLAGLKTMLDRERPAVDTHDSSSVDYFNSFVEKYNQYGKIQYELYSPYNREENYNLILKNPLQP